MSEYTRPRQISEADDISGFTCGVPVVDEWLTHRFRTALHQRTAIPYGVFQGNALVGFYTLSAYAIDRDSARGWLARNSPNPVPTVLLGMLGVDIRHQTQHLGGSLLKDATIRAMSAADIIGARALITEPATDNAVGFYEHYGFRHIRGSSMMFAPLQTELAQSEGQPE